jgi:hypothetical protein
MSEGVAVVIAFVVLTLVVVAFWFGGALKASVLLRPGSAPRRTRPHGPRRDDLPGNRDVSP